ncbi:PHOsphatase [Mortierella alpina]|nr:PHOsphatase [Mortierella alpina]
MVAQPVTKISFGRWLISNLGFVLPSIAAVCILLMLEPAVVEASSLKVPLDPALEVHRQCSTSTFDLWTKSEPKRASGMLVSTFQDERPSPPRLSFEPAVLQSSQRESQLAQTLAVIGGQEEHLQTRFTSPAESRLSHFPKKLPFPSSSWIRKHLASKSPYPHGSRKVKPLDMEDIPHDHELVQLHLRAETLYPVTKGSLLAPEGDSDLYKIGRRFAVRYKDFLDKHPYDANTYEFHSSGKSRCRQSAYGFTVGFLEGRHADDLGKIVPKMESGKSPVQPVDISALPVGMDQELAVQYACPRWLETVKGQPKVVYEAQTYKEKTLTELAEQLSIRYAPQDGVGEVNFTVKDIQTIYTACGFEVSLYGNDQTWCQLLRLASPSRALELEETHASEEDIKSTFLKLEISSDLGKYYTFGPGVPFNRHLGCKLATSLLESIELALAQDADNSPSRRTGDNDEDGEGTLNPFRGHFKFGHSETIMFFSSFLGLYNKKGVRMTATMTPEQYEEREFKTSDFSPFAANMAFEVYKPKAAKSSSRKWRLSDEKETPPPSVSLGKVRMLVNEEPMILAGCRTEFCEWSMFKSILEDAGARCDFETCCKSQDTPSEDAPPLTWLETMSRVRRHVRQHELDDGCLAVDPITG